MADTRTREQRSRIMKSVGTKDTGPELIVRRLIHARGYRYRLHCRSLPGKPDIVFAGRRKVIFVHGCFWHGHSCRLGRPPKSRPGYWLPKLELNRKRDAANIASLRRLGYSTMIVWQCQIKRPGLMNRIERFLGCVR